MAKRPRRDSADSGLNVPILTHQEAPGRRSSSMTPVAKISSSSTEQQPPQGRRGVMMHHYCSLPPHRETIDFASYDEYETHYLQTHVNRCSECGRNFPTLHFLSIHIEENHDPLILARRDRGEKTNYNFFIVNDGVDKQTSLLRLSNGPPRRSQTSQSPQEGRLRNRETSFSLPEILPGNNIKSANNAVEKNKKQGNSDQIDALVSSMSALDFVPASVTRRLEEESHKKMDQG
ncbi:hypothetical protein PISL3812_04121 [Talaromyces islandicus]|uniref:C2H2-type domain-containing protein n=1 Tax=Talaromyces islandicus TaxID=28573 RepID=A0A0U1LWE1_TALIS|nr:hypothetical protein PISL3812_04121 [Talaromyces islandicus]